MDEWPPKPELPVPEHAAVAQLYYQPVKREAVSAPAEIERLKHIVITASIDGNALALATALRDLLVHDVHVTHESLVMAGGATPLHLTVEANRPATLAVLVDAGCDVNVRNRIGDTPAHIAARNNFTECIRLLGSPQALADFSIADADGNSAEEVAALAGHGAAVTLIQQLVKTDEDVHMVKRRHAEVARQRQMVRLKERLYGRSFLSLEGGPEFELPPRSLLNAENRWAMGAGVRSFATVPVVLDKGVNKALSRVLASSQAAAHAEHQALLEALAREEAQAQADEEKQRLDDEEEEEGKGEERELARPTGSALKRGGQGAGDEGYDDNPDWEDASTPASPEAQRLREVNTQSAIARSRASVLKRAEARAAGEFARVRVRVLRATLEGSTVGAPQGSSSGSSSSNTTAFVELAFSANGPIGVPAEDRAAASGTGTGGGADEGAGGFSDPSAAAAALTTESSVGGLVGASGSDAADGESSLVVGFRTDPMELHADSALGTSSARWDAEPGMVFEVYVKAAKAKAISARGATGGGGGGRGAPAGIRPPNNEDEDLASSEHSCLVASIFLTSSSSWSSAGEQQERGEGHEGGCLGRVSLPAAAFLLEPPTAAPAGGSWAPFLDGASGRAPQVGWEVTAPLRSLLSSARPERQATPAGFITLGFSVVPSSADDEDGEESEEGDEEGDDDSDDGRRWDDFSDDGENNPRDFIPGRISESRWIDLSRGRPPDLGYSSCV